MTQTERVLAALQAAGPAGITVVDFLAPDVIDQGKPITRVAARVLELRKAGYVIVKAGIRNCCHVYVLQPPVPPDGGEPSMGEARPFGGLFAHDPEPLNALIGDVAA